MCVVCIRGCFWCQQQTFCSRYFVFKYVNIGPSSSFPGFLAEINKNGAVKYTVKLQQQSYAGSQSPLSKGDYTQTEDHLLLECCKWEWQSQNIPSLWLVSKYTVFWKHYSTQQQMTDSQNCNNLTASHVTSTSRQIQDSITASTLNYYSLAHKPVFQKVSLWRQQSQWLAQNKGPVC